MKIIILYMGRFHPMWRGYKRVGRGRTFLVIPLSVVGDYMVASLGLELILGESFVVFIHTHSNNKARHSFIINCINTYTQTNLLL